MTRSDWHWRLREMRATLGAAALFAALFTLYIAKHPVGWDTGVLVTAANKGVLLAIVAMAQTLAVLTGGIDLSVGMVFVLATRPPRTCGPPVCRPPRRGFACMRRRKRIRGFKRPPICSGRSTIVSPRPSAPGWR